MKNSIQNITLLISDKKRQYLQEGFEIVGIFGSYAQGGANKYSDIDIAYKLDFDTFDKQFKGGFSKLLRIEEIKDELQKLLHLKVDLVSMNSDNMKFQNKIKKDMLYV
ncbi:MAG: nucleotidyltransferase domain-containing protein [Campylobacterota bacterium]|nr:nucleotidyltransferase domain-containing protein [Campylobacterota bacterium]